MNESLALLVWLRRIQFLREAARVCALQAAHSRALQEERECRREAVRVVAERVRRNASLDCAGSAGGLGLNLEYDRWLVVNQRRIDTVHRGVLKALASVREDLASHRRMLATACARRLAAERLCAAGRKALRLRDERELEESALEARSACSGRRRRNEP